MTNKPSDAAASRNHNRRIGWPGAVGLAMAGSNLSVFIIGPLMLSQGSAGVPLLILGLLLGLAAMPGWLEMVLMSPHRVGGIAASCVDALRPSSPLLAALTGVWYWWA